ncbi:hypothetical protein Tco_0440090 [Tanacetum coccineum]
MQISVGQSHGHKFSAKVYGQYQVIVKVGKVANKLDLLKNAKIYLVFYVSQLKKGGDKVVYVLMLIQWASGIVGVTWKWIEDASWSWQMGFHLRDCLVPLGSYVTVAHSYLNLGICALASLMLTTNRVGLMKSFGSQSTWAKYDMGGTFSALTQESLGALVKKYCIPLDLRRRLPDPNLSMNHLPTDSIVVLVRSCLSSVWLNQKCDMVFRRKDNNYGRPDDAKVVEEPHGFVDSILQRVENHTTAPATEGALIPKPTPKEIIASPFEVIYPKRKRKLKSKASDVGSSTPAAEHGDDAKDVDQGNDLSETDYCVYLEGNLERDEGNSFRAAYFPNLRYSKRLGLPPPRLSNTAPSDPYYASTSNVANASSFDHVDTRRGIAPVGVAGKAQAEVMDLLAQSALARDREYDNIPDDDFSSATLGEEIEITLFPLAPGPYYMPYPFAEACRAPLRVNDLKEKHEKVQQDCHARDQENKYLLDLNDASSNDVKKLMDQLSEGEAVVTRDMDAATEQRFDVLQSEVRFVSSDFDSLVRKLLSSDEFNATLACILSLGITFGAELDKAIADIPSTHFPFLAKISEATESTLPEVASIQPDKIARPDVSASAPATFSPTCKTFGWTSTLKASEPTGLAHDASPSSA